MPGFAQVRIFKDPVSASTHFAGFWLARSTATADDAG